MEHEEELLRQSMHAQTDQSLSSSAIAKALTSGRKRKRQRQFAATAAAAVLVVSAGVTLPGLLLDDSTGGATIAQESPGATDRNAEGEAGSTTSPAHAINWAQSLPEASDPGLAILDGQALSLPGGSIELPGTGADLIGMTVRGVLVFLEFDNLENGGTISSEYAIVSPDGEITTLPPSAGSTYIQEGAVSSDGLQVAYGNKVRDVRTLEAVADIPSDAVSPISWTPYGLLYFSANNDIFLWTPGQGSPRSIGENPGIFPNHSVAGFRNDSPCSDVVELQADGDVVRTTDDCVARPLISVSPDGSFALDNDLGIVSVPSGSVRDLDESAPKNVNAYAPVVWTSNSSFVFPVAGPAAKGHKMVLLVECDANDGECERVGDPLTKPAEIDILKY